MAPPLARTDLFQPPLFSVDGGGPGSAFASSVVNPSPATTYAPNTVGGTSGGGAGSGANVLSVNLGGSTFNYDLGPNTDYFAQGAYKYLNNSFEGDQAFLGSTIAGSQNFLASFAAPLEAFNVTTLPNMFETLNTQNFALGTEALNAESSVAQASVAASRASAAQASSSGGGICFLTTATCEVMGEADDGPTLRALRGFRDTFMLSSPARRRLVELYYERAPKMLERIRARRDARTFLERIFTVYIMPARDCIERGQEREAFLIYTKLMCDLHAVLQTA